jgi:DNA-binding NtrC family response regulator
MIKDPKILIIDDEHVIRIGCKQALQPAGFAVDFAENAIIGFAKLSESNYDLVLIDIMMPQIRGTSLIESIRKFDPSIIIIAITGYATPELMAEVLQKGAFDYLAKPFTPDELRHAVKKGLEKRDIILKKNVKEIEM